MAFLEYEGVGITAMAAAVPRTVIKNYEYTQYFPAEEVKEVVDKVGIYERRFADENTCASDLCFAAAEKLIEDNHIDRSEIDLLIFISQTPDYRMPATSVILQERLKLGNSTIAFDINLVAGEYSATVKFDGDADYGFKSIVTMITVTKKPTAITAPNKSLLFTANVPQA